MVKTNFKFGIPVLVFVLVALSYFSPVLRGYKLFQSDIQQFRGMSKEIKDFREKNETEPYWTDAAFGGMPSYQLSTYYPNDFVKKLDSLLRFLPRPADYLFLYFLGFFILLGVLKFDWKLAMMGSLAFGFSTYFIIILGVGHNAKAHAIGYIPFVISGILLVFQKKYFYGFLWSTLAIALEVNASHPQMTYYLFFSLLILGVVMLVEKIKTKEHLGVFMKEIGLLFVAATLALGMNASSLLATKEYADHSTRGKSALTITPEGKEKEVRSGLSKSYITEYSYGILETLNLFIPRFTGGANSENLGEESATYSFLVSKIDRRQAAQFSENTPTYWGSQPIVAAPAYIGAIFIFLFVLGIFLVKGSLKKWLLATTVFSIVMSWGHHFSLLTDFFIDWIPLYNKFRAVSSIQILAEIAIPLLGLLGLKEFVYGNTDKSVKQEALKKSFFILGGLALFFVLFGVFLFDFQGRNDAYYDSMLEGLSNAIVTDRKHLFFNDSLRSFGLVALFAGFLYAILKEKIKTNKAVYVLGALLLFDTVGIARRYVNSEDFLPARKVEKPFVKSAIDQEILKDKGHYRVANFSGNFMNDGATSYFHKSIGGYHAAKMGRYQELVDFHIAKNNSEVLNMLHTKYFIFPDERGQKFLEVNPSSNGNAWFVNKIVPVDTADEEILRLVDFDSKQTAIVNQREFSLEFEKLEVDDPNAKIQLLSYQANALVYESENSKNQLAVFSEIYYKDGWNAYIDGELTPHLRANYVLRALEIPAGKHRIEFKFEPTVIAKGNVVNISSWGVFLMLLLGGRLLMKRRKRQKTCV
jgi:hypothetical protein